MAKSSTKKTAFAAVVAIVVFMVAFAARYTFVVNQNKAKQENLNARIARFSVFDPVLPGKPVILPRDFGLHLGYQYESSTFFANLTDDNGTKYWASWDVYRVALDENMGSGWRQPHVFVANASLSTSTFNLFEQRVARGGIGLVGVEERPFRFWIDNWEWKALTRYPLPGKLRVDGDSFSLDLKSYANGPYVIGGDNGYRPKHDLVPVASYQFGAPFLKVNGQVSISGREVDVSGVGWLAKEWGSNLLDTKLQGMDRFGIHLSDGRRLSINQSRINKQLPYVFGTIANKIGAVVELSDDDISIKPNRFAFLRGGQRVPVQWVISIPEHDIQIVVDALNQRQWLPSLIPYWIGAVEITGSHGGEGFMQLMGY